MRCFAAVLLFATVFSAFAAEDPDLDALCKEKYGDAKSRGSKVTEDKCKVNCHGTDPLEFPSQLFLEDGAKCDAGKSCLMRRCNSNADIEACKTALGEATLDHIHTDRGNCRVRCHATDRTKDTDANRPDGGLCGFFNSGTCKEGKCSM